MKIDQFAIIICICIIIGGVGTLILLNNTGTSEPHRIQTQSNTGIVDITQRDFQENISFSNGISSANSYLAQAVVGNVTLHNIHYIRGHGVDYNGNAIEWVIGYNDINQNYLLECGPNVQSLRKWNGDLPDKEIRIDDIIKPEALFKLQKSRLFNGPIKEKYNIEIQDGLYYVTNDLGSSSETYRFNAYSGEFIQND